MGVQIDKIILLGDPGFLQKANILGNLSNTGVYDDGTNIGLNKTSGITAKFHAKSINKLNTHFGFKLDNSDDEILVAMRNDGFFGLGTTTELTGGTGYKFESLSPLFTGLGTGLYWTGAFMSNNEYGIDKGAGITFGGKYNSSGAYTVFGGINAVKETSASGNFAGRLNLWVRNSSTATVCMTSVSFGSKFRNGMGITNPTALLHLEGDNADVFISSAKCITTHGYAAKLLANEANTADNIALYAQASNGANNFAAILDGKIRSLNLPTSAAGLSAGDIWNNSGILTIV